MITGITFGCFDLFHVGHLRFLQAASRQCEFLYIGVFTDKVIQRYKKKKPIIPLMQRIEILKGLSLNCPVKIFGLNFRGPVPINQTILFVSMRLLDKNLIMKGYHSKCDIMYMPYTDDISTSKIRYKVLADG